MKKSKPNVLLVQPHSDDILFSCSNVLFNHEKYNDITILTIENNPKRILEDKKLEDLFPVKIKTLDFDYIDKSHKEYFKKYPHIDPACVMEFMGETLGDKKIEELYDQIIKKLKEACDHGCIIYTCLGIGHPFHYLVHAFTKDQSDFFYREWPHSYKRRNEAHVKELKSEFTFVEKFDSEENHALKFQIAKEIYKTQSSLLFFEQGKIKKQYPEEIYK